MKIRIIFTIAVLSVISILAFPTQKVFAIDSASLQSKGLTLSPLRREMNITPGTSLDGKLTVTNSTDKPMVVDMAAEEFSVINQQYDYVFTADSNVTKWVTFNPSGVNLKAGESKKIAYTVGVPMTAGPGGLYISLFASTSVGNLDGGANSQQRVASLLYITVASDVLGDTTQAGHVISLTSPWLVSGKTIWSVALQNAGITHYRSNYEVKINNLFGSEVASSQGSALILPGTVRLVSDTLPLPQWPGVYKIVYSIGLGDTPAVTETRYMLYMPPLATVVAVAIITALFLAPWRRLFKK
ncbi:hypothetical protein AUK57_02035 [Candidatus Saccharibacteria bacterium CG2_30_41_52]|nr:MAG: hypothetical protein AUK57_02035 [Candidatus Saccharibacteria bacterium CG2_30_41_52]PIZ60257.1 MAG: hypothetical protein COY18_01515 [Candidatus Saccharibacteria bacterium CG_4_10_14_0_2_um_filter_41_11]PJE66228.1 MAG: hypothetical protein COU92_00995 [Candidatus Saccharibacteria bacterium CG10_big_fil_rev_8_21_14_0_10_41_32]